MLPKAPLGCPSAGGMLLGSMKNRTTEGDSFPSRTMLESKVNYPKSP